MKWRARFSQTISGPVIQTSVTAVHGACYLRNNLFKFPNFPLLTLHQRLNWPRDIFQSVTKKSENGSVLENMFVCQDIQPKILIQVQELRESRGGRPGLPVLMGRMFYVDVKPRQHWTMLTHWSHCFPSISVRHPPRTVSSTSSSLFWGRKQGNWILNFSEEHTHRKLTGARLNNSSSYDEITEQYIAGHGLLSRTGKRLQNCGSRSWHRICLWAVVQ